MKLGDFLENYQRERLKKLQIISEQKRLKNRRQTVFEEVKNESGVCVLCGTENKITVDHIIPKRTLRAAGVPPKFWHRKYNLQTFCKFHNNQKHHYVNLDFKTIYLMMFYWLVSKFYKL